MESVTAVCGIKNTRINALWVIPWTEYQGMYLYIFKVKKAMDLGTGF